MEGQELAKVEPIGQCDHCYKRLETERLSIPYLWKDALNNLFNLERGLFFTFYWLLRSPAKVIHTFVDGNRHRYMNPFRFLLFAATFIVISEAILVNTTSYTLFDVEGSNAASSEVIGDFMKNYMNVIILFSVPFYTLGSWLIFRKPKWNLAEHLVVNAYAISMIVLLSSVISLIAYPFGDTVASGVERISQLLNFFLAYVYIVTWSYKWWKGLLKMMLSFFISSILAGTFLFGLGYLFNVLNP
ncbi:MAG: DUF3667 domain-containing protein [Flavobacteriales bacterium]|nr:DUF3667 domain-containing protein [Flavobacteriales bacterium]